MKHAMHFSLFASVLLVSQACFAAQHAMPERVKRGTPVPIEQVRKNVEALNQSIGSYPPHIKSGAERTSVYAQWSVALQHAWRLEAAEPRSESTLALLSELYRQGHNLDVNTSAELADQTISKCLAAFPVSVPCHFSASYFYLSVNPASAPKGEASLKRLRELFKPKVNHDVERGFVFAYLYQGRTSEALKQLDYFLTLDPGAGWAREIREGIVNGKGRVVKSR